MRAPTLRQVEGDLARITRLAPRLAESARWAWPMAYARLRHLPHAAGGETSRPVEAALSTEGAPEWVVRDNVNRAGVLIGRAAQLLELANGCLARAHDLADATPPPAPGDAGPPLVSKAELDRARKAKARRDAARPPGTGYGEY